MARHEEVEVMFLPCPFCGKQPKVYSELLDPASKDSPKYYVAHCTSCHLRMNHWTPPELEHLWNQRADLTNENHLRLPMPR